MAHKAFDQLRLELRAASKQVTVGGTYRHYKGHDYTVLDLVILEADDAIAVIYCDQTKPDVHFVRPLTSWLERVEYEGERVERFRLIP